MQQDNPRSTASIFGHPIHPMLVPFPITCFIGAFLTDLAYFATTDMLWASFSVWLITAGLVTGVFAAIAGIVDYAGSARVRAKKPALPHGIGNGLVMVLSLFNAFVHSRDGYTAVVPTGLTLSAIVTVLLLVTAWLGGSLSYVHRVGVAN